MAQRDADEMSSARFLPNFEGDFWGEEIERQAEKLQEEGDAAEDGADAPDGASEATRKSMCWLVDGWWLK